MDDVPQPILESGKWVVNCQWVVDEKIASGGFGAVYKGRDILNNEVVAVKTEKRKNKQNYVEKEVQIYRAIGNSRGFPRMRWTGKTTYPSDDDEDEEERTCMAMVIDLLGPSLSDLFYKHQKMFSLKTVLMLADQMLERLEVLHEKGVVHRDIKPGNFVMGRGNNSPCVYLIDFGLAHKYRSVAGTHIKFDDNVPFRGTHRYASINAHMKIEQTRRDDLESLGYVLIYFLKGGLPWQNLNVERNKRRQVIGEMKKNTSVSEITSGLPAEFATFLNNVRNLQFQEKPDYKMLRGLFKKCYVDQTFLQDGVYDWSQPTPPSHPHDSPNQSQTEPSPPRSHKKIPKTYTNTNSIEILEVKSNAPPPVSIPINTKKRKDHSSDEIDVQNKKN